MIKELIITGILVTLLLLPTINTINAATETPVFYAITQSSTTNLVEPILGNVPSDEFYDYWSSSGHTLYMEDQVSKIYLYKDDTGALSLIIHHSIDNSEEDYMRVDFDFEGVPEAAYVALSDDNSHFWGGHPNGREFDLSQNPEGSWEFYHNSDGGVLAGLPIDEPWTITITPNFVEGLTAWEYQEAKDTIPLDMQEPLIISSDLSNVSPDPGFILNFENLAGGGTITVGRLFGCKEPQFPTPVFDIQVTVEFGVAQICMYYDDSQLTRGQERNLRFLSTEQIIEGDVNLDGLVDHKDVQQVKQAIKLWNENPDDLNINNNGYGNGWNPLCDINCDKVVDDQDLDIVLFHLGEVSPWIDITTGIDTELNMLYGETDKFSIFRAH